jgi:hypothetical protein
MNKSELSIGYAELEKDKTYPLYGYITNIKDNFITISSGVTFRANVGKDALNTLKERAFELAIFVVTVENPDLDADSIGICSTIVFGKKPQQELQ